MSEDIVGRITFSRACLPHIEMDRQFRERMIALLKEARLEITYLHEKFQETGSGNAVLARIDALLKEAK